MIPVEKPGSPADILEHYGAKGMHWGIRKKEETSNRKPAQPKQISPKKEARAKRHEEAAKNVQPHIDAIRANPSKIAYIQNNRNAQIKSLEDYRDQHIKDAKDIREGHLTDGQKKALVGAGVVVGILAAYGTYKLVDSGTARQMLNKKVSFNRNSQLARHMSPDEIMKEVVPAINPGYGGVGTKMNCRRCTFAFEMRRRGLDVKSTNSISGTGQTVAGLLNATNPESNMSTGKFGIVKALMKEGGKEGPLSTALETAHGLGKEGVGGSGFSSSTAAEKTASIFKAIGQHPDGARGELGVSWGMGGAHSMAWEMIGGQPHIFDTQSGKDFNFAKFAEDYAPNVSQAGITRLDNVNLNTGYLRKWVQNA